MIEAPSETYIKAAMSLEESKKKRLLFKMRCDLAHNLEDEPDTIQALAIQLQTEAEELAEC